MTVRININGETNGKTNSKGRKGKKKKSINQYSENILTLQHP